MLELEMVEKSQVGDGSRVGNDWLEVHRAGKLFHTYLGSTWNRDQFCPH